MENIIIDTDTAGDDVTSIMLAALSPINLISISIAAGNVPVELGAKNALLTLEKVNKKNVPVFIGSRKPMLRDLVTAQYVHGNDGMGNSNFPDPQKQPENGNASAELVNYAEMYKKNLIICAQAPLTNIALATLMDNNFPKNVKHLYIMGGTYRHAGNITPAAEYNFFVDPEAAYIVLKSGFNATILPWDLCAEHGTITIDEIMHNYEKNKTDLFKFYLDVNRSAIEYNKSGKSGININGLTHSDSLLMSCILNNDIIMETKNVRVDISIEDEITRGFSSMIPDDNSKIKVITRINEDKFKKFLFGSLQNGIKD
ncbi:MULTISPECIES: nucleoside hydrolase [unclassified Acidiplasma]|nr:MULTISPECIES: nucleoside hydrolase [unclassified Acidiplasma]WMT55419.1 MAG: nucleoside hydrolase [Acidiplasma sp.]